MIYKIVSIGCDTIADGYTIAYVELQQQANTWSFDNFIKTAFQYPAEWKQKLSNITRVSVTEFINCHREFGQFLGDAVKKFIAVNTIEFKVQLIALKGFDLLETHELGNAAQIAAVTGINVVSNFRDIHTALDGNGSYQNSVAAGLFGGQEDAIQLAMLAVLRWREENNFLSHNTGARRNSIGGAVWMGQEA